MAYTYDTRIYPILFGYTPITLLNAIYSRIDPRLITYLIPNSDDRELIPIDVMPKRGVVYLHNNINIFCYFEIPSQVTHNSLDLSVSKTIQFLT